MSLGVGEAGYGAGNSAGLVADERHAGNDVALGVEVHVAGGGGGCLLAVVEEVRLAMLIADEHEAASAEVAGEGVDDGKGEVYGDGCVDGVAALFKDGEAGVGGIVFDGDDHGVGGAGGFEIGLLGEEGGGWKEAGGAEKGGNRMLDVAGSSEAQGFPPTA